MAMQLRIPRVEDFSHRLRGPQTTARVGVWLAITFSICFLTGIWSHFQQDTPSWLAIPASPASLYRVTQGLHIISGTASIPLLLVKLWSVFPKFFERPPTKVSRELVLHMLERLSIAALVGAAIFELASGMMNIIQWYPWDFSFRRTHFAVAWIVIGALIVHIAVKLPIIRDALTSPLETGEPKDSSGLSRRGLLLSTGGAVGLTILLTAGQTVPILRRISVFGVRTGDGPQGLPINRTARAAGIGEIDDAWALEVSHKGRTVSMSLADLAALPQSTVDLPIACVEGWSANATWTGIPMRDIATLVGAPARSRMFLTSLQTRGAFGKSELPHQFVEDERTLLALKLNGEVLNPDHGYPCRVIAPNRPGVLQTKWVTKIEVFA
ncbi:MAG: molybdopterin-binding protein [Nocardioidaceae bacterium]|nr:molybdopterin-binding protein [Nocardioidaceae bacterium]